MHTCIYYIRIEFALFSNKYVCAYQSYIEFYMQSLIRINCQPCDFSLPFFPCTLNLYAYFTRESNTSHSESRAAYLRFSTFIHRDRMHACMSRARGSIYTQAQNCVWLNKLIRNSVLSPRDVFVDRGLAEKAVADDACVCECVR